MMRKYLSKAENRAVARLWSAALALASASVFVTYPTTATLDISCAGVLLGIAAMAVIDSFI